MFLSVKNYTITMPTAPVTKATTIMLTDWSTVVVVITISAGKSKLQLYNERQIL